MIEHTLKENLSSAERRRETRRKNKQWQYILGYNEGVAVGLKEGERNGYEDGVKAAEERAEKRILGMIAKGTYRLPSKVLKMQIALQVGTTTSEASTKFTGSWRGLNGHNSMLISHHRRHSIPDPTPERHRASCITSS